MFANSIYGLEACPLTSADRRVLDFVIHRFLIKMFNTTNAEIISDCQMFFDFKSPSEILDQRTARFVAKFNDSYNYLCRYIAAVQN